MTKRERIEAALRREECDRVPVSFWRHFYDREGSAKDLAESMLAFEREFDWDFLKVNPRAAYHVEGWGARFAPIGEPRGKPKLVEAAVRDPFDWGRIKSISHRKGPLGEQLEAIELIGEGLGGEVPFVETIFTPLSVAGDMVPADDDLVNAIREHPDRVYSAVDAIADTFSAFAEEVIARGADGIFFATTQWASRDRLTDEEYREFGRPYDLRILEAAKDAGLLILHVCDRNNMLDLVADYPVHAFNWAISLPGNVGLAEGAEMTGRAVIGGVDEDVALMEETPDASLGEAEAAVAATGGRGWILGPGCAVPTRVKMENLRALREWAEEAQG
jgi:uroporphyrinogen decarboxylase